MGDSIRSIFRDNASFFVFQWLVRFSFIEYCWCPLLPQRNRSFVFAKALLSLIAFAVKESKALALPCDMSCSEAVPATGNKHDIVLRNVEDIWLVSSFPTPKFIWLSFSFAICLKLGRGKDLAVSEVKATYTTLEMQKINLWHSFPKITTHSAPIALKTFQVRVVGPIDGVLLYW